MEDYHRRDSMSYMAIRNHAGERLEFEISPLGNSVMLFGNVPDFLPRPIKDPNNESLENALEHLDSLIEKAGWWVASISKF